MGEIDVVGLGALNIDHLYRVERILGDGETVADEAGMFPGGSSANTIYGLAKLRMMAGFIGVVGDDAEGKILMQDFQKVGVDISQIKVKPGVRTGSALCLSDKLGRRSLYVSPGANSLLTMDDLNLTYINQAKWLHLSSFVDDKQFNILPELMNGLDPHTKLSFSPGVLYAKKGLRPLAPMLSRTHVLFLNQSEIHQLTREKDVRAGTECCLRQGCDVIVVTLGKGTRLESGEGVSHKAVTAAGYIRDAKTEHIIEPRNQSIISEDTTGAGDAFATGFLYGLLKGKSLEKCGRLANIVAEFSITRVGAREGLPNSTELAHRYQKLYSEQL